MRLETALEPDCVACCGEEDVNQILRNLIENAIKYNSPGGHVLVSTHCQGGQVVLEVADSGVGIPEEDLPRIFERFYRVDKARSRAAGGTGLGLSIVLDTVRLYDGDVTVQSTLGEGSCFTATLPAWTQEEGEA